MPFGPFGLFGMRFDLPEFFVGIVAGILIAFLLLRFVPVFSFTSDRLQGRFATIRESMMAGARERYRQELIAVAETMHSARAVFTLREIMVPPRLLAPAMPSDPLRTDPLPEDSLGVLPSLPDWVFLSGIYRAPTLSMSEAISNNTSFMVTGQPGSGKTTALAYLALSLARGDKQFESIANHLPVMVSALDIEWGATGDENDPLEPIIAVVQRHASSGLAPRIPTYLHRAFENNRGLLLLDGLDEMAPDELAIVSQWFRGFNETYPENLIIAAGPASGYDGLVKSGLAPVAMAPWGEHEHRLFLDQWTAAWQKHVVPKQGRNQLGEIDPALINGWLLGMVRGKTPLEALLTIWSAYAGDSEGASILDHYEAYLARFLSQGERQAAEAAAQAWIEERKGAPRDKVFPRGTPTGDFVDAGILVRRTGGKVSFFQPAIGAYLAGKSMSKSGAPEAAEQSGWVPASMALSFYAAFTDAGPMADRFIEDFDDPSFERGLLVGYWLRDAPPKSAWRAKVLRYLAQVLNDQNRPYGLRLRITHALVRSDEEQVMTLFRRMLQSDARSSRVLAALGSGGMRDFEAVEPLSKITQQDSDLHVLHAACLGLAAIGNDPALETLGSILLQGEESMRLAAAEALAVHPDEGYSMLREAIDFDDLLTRRAAVFGLARIPEPWALDTLERIHLEDSEWVVRGAGAEALEKLTDPPWKIHAPALDISDIPWLVAYASKEGLGVAPGSAGFEMVRRALNTGTMEEKVAAMEAIGFYGGEEFAMELYQALKGDETALRDAAYEAIWRLNAAGVELPSPVGFGLG